MNNKPKWKDAPDWAQWLAQDKNGTWVWCENKPQSFDRQWDTADGQVAVAGESDSNENWRNTLERRPDDHIVDVNKMVMDTDQDHFTDASNMVWQPIESAPKDGTEILAWRDDCGIFIASYTSLDCFPMSQSEIDRLDEETLFAKDWFTQWPQALRLESSEVPTHWQPLPELPTE